MARGLRICRICRDEKKLSLEQAYVPQGTSRRDHLGERHPDADWDEKNWDEDQRKYFRVPTRLEKDAIAQLEGAERLLYDPVKAEFERLFQHVHGRCHLEITAMGQFTEKLKEKVREPIVFSFIRRMKGSEHRSPDITGFATDPKTQSDYLVTIEVKDDPVSLWDVYQAKMYAELFNAKYGFLVSTHPIPTELKKLHQVHFVMNRFMSVTYLCLVEFDAKASKIVHDTWFPDPPFKYDPKELESKEVQPMPAYEALSLESFSFGSNQAARLHIFNSGKVRTEIYRYSIDKAEPKFFTPSIVIEPGEARTLTIIPNPSSEFQSNHRYVVTVVTRKANQFVFVIGGDPN